MIYPYRSDHDATKQVLKADCSGITSLMLVISVGKDILYAIYLHNLSQLTLYSH